MVFIHLAAFLLVAKVLVSGVFSSSPLLISGMMPFLSISQHRKALKRFHRKHFFSYNKNLDVTYTAVMVELINQ